MPTIRSLQNYTYPAEEVKQAIAIKKNDRLFFPTKQLEKKYKPFTVSEEDDNVLVFKKRVLIPEDKVRETIDMEYKKSFAGMNRLFQQMLRKYIGVSEDEVIKYVKNQEVQQLHDQTTTPSLQQTKERPIPKEPFSMVQIDLAKFCYRYLFVAIDVLSKHLWVKGVACCHKNG